MPHNEHLSKSITIHTSAATLWAALTTPESMKHWMTEPGLEIHIITTWQPRTPITMYGHIHNIHFKNYGTVNQFIPERLLEYSHLSSLSNLPDLPENYTLLTFNIASSNNQTTLTLTISNTPTESIYKHLELYWNATLPILKKFTEQDTNSTVSHK